MDVSEDGVVLELCSNDETLAIFPYEFRLVSTFTLEGATLHHTLTVENEDDAPLPFGIGYHPAFAIPFDDKHTATDYEFRFSETESPICINNLPHGLVHGNIYLMPANIQSIPIDEHLFDNDSHCMVNLRSQKIGVYEKGTGRGVVCDIADFPYTLIWSMPHKGMPRYVCIEPWHSLPSPEGGSQNWEEKPAAAVLNPGECWSTTLSTEFVR